MSIKRGDRFLNVTTAEVCARLEPSMSNASATTRRIPKKTVRMTRMTRNQVHNLYKPITPKLTIPQSRTPVAVATARNAHARSRKNTLTRFRKIFLSSFSPKTIPSIAPIITHTRVNQQSSQMVTISPFTNSTMRTTNSAIPTRFLLALILFMDSVTLPKGQLTAFP